MYTKIHGEGTMELLATLSEGVFNNDFLSYLVQIFPQQDTNTLIATMKNKSTQQQSKCTANSHSIAVQNDACFP